MKTRFVGIMTNYTQKNRGMGFAQSICNTNAKLEIKGDKNVFHKEKENTEILRAKSRE